MMRHAPLLVICLLATFACRDQPDREAAAVAQPDTGGTAVVALGTNIDFANGLLSGEIYSQEVNSSALFLPLLRYGKDRALEPLLAQAWQMSGDTAVVMQLRNDVRWHDGVKTTAYDVEFTYRYGSNAATGYPNADYWTGWTGAEVLDSFAIRFTFDAQPEPLANLPWIPIMPRHLLERYEPAELRNAPFNQSPVGNGPFRFVEYRPNDRWVFAANHDYPEGLGGRPLLGRLVFRIIPDESAQEAELRSGGVDLITKVRAERYAELSGQDEFYGIEKPSRQFAFIAWNTRRPPFDDARVRRALTMAIDRQRMTNALWRGHAQVAVGPVPPYHWSYDARLPPLTHSVDSARTLLAAAGIVDRDGDGYVDLPGGREFRIELKLPSNNQLNADIAELVRSDLAIAGIRMATRPMEFNTMVADATSPARRFDAVLLGWQSDFRLVLHDMFHSSAADSPFQFSSYRNSEVDQLLDQLAVTTAREAALPLWQRLQRVMRDQQPWTFLFYYPNFFVARERLHAVEMDIRGALVNLPEWYVTQ